MREELLTAPRPRIDPAGAERVLARRDAGERIELGPVLLSTTSRSETGRRNRILPITLASAAALLLWFGWPRGRSRVDEPSATTASRDAARDATRDAADATAKPPAATSEPSTMAEILSPWPAIAYAATVPDTEQLFESLNASGGVLLTPGTRRYVRSSASPYHESMPIGALSVEFVDTVYAKVPVWRVVTSRPLEQLGVVDTAWIRRFDFMTLLRRSHMYRNTLTQRVVGDTLLRQTFDVQLPDSIRAKIDPRKFTIDQRISLSRRPLITDASTFMLLLRTQSLHARWRGSIDVNAFRAGAGAAMQARSVNVAVEGDSLVSTLWGHVPCWRVVVHSGMTPERWYVSKEGREVLLMTGPNGMEWPRSRLDLMGRYLK